VISERGYSSRSEAIRDAIRGYINSYKWIDSVEGKRIGILSLVYEHDQHGLADDLTEIQHRHMQLITASVHVHLDLGNCLEIIMLQGEGKDIKEVADAVTTLKGVKYVKLNTISPDKNYR
jgi:CopG family nickel-responsive transcriptional regulator